MARKPVRYIDDMWQSYRRVVVPKDATPIQLIESERAFKAGAASLHMSVMRGLTAGTDANEPDIAFMQDLQAEIDAIGTGLDTALLHPTKQ